eukprot:scaffold7222_cov107-Isochrysis_galbana.AAC.2
MGKGSESRRVIRHGVSRRVAANAHTIKGEWVKPRDGRALHPQPEGGESRLYIYSLGIAIKHKAIRSLRMCLCVSHHIQSTHKQPPQPRNERPTFGRGRVATPGRTCPGCGDEQLEQLVCELGGRPPTRLALSPSGAAHLQHELPHEAGQHGVRDDRAHGVLLLPPAGLGVLMCLGQVLLGHSQLRRHGKRHAARGPGGGGRHGRKLRQHAGVRLVLPAGGYLRGEQSRVAPGWGNRTGRGLVCGLPQQPRPRPHVPGRLPPRRPWPDRSPQSAVWRGEKLVHCGFKRLG